MKIPYYTAVGQGVCGGGRYIKVLGIVIIMGIWMSLLGTVFILGFWRSYYFSAMRDTTGWLCIGMVRASVDCNDVYAHRVH